MRFLVKTAVAGAASAVMAAVLATSALADGMPKRGSIRSAEPAPAPRACTLSANVGLTSDYVFRGVSQTAEGPAIQGGFDATCVLFYVGTWASAVDFDDAAHVEIDLYAGIKPKTGPITWDLGVIYYAYPNQNNAFELNMVEFKVGGSAEIWKDGTAGLTAFYSPDYTNETGPVWTFEAAFSQALPKVGMFSPTFSALFGYQIGDDARYLTVVGNGEDSYMYWNAGLTLGFLEKWSLDLRYWDSSLSSNVGGAGFCGGPTFHCDERFVATLKFTY